MEVYGLRRSKTGQIQSAGIPKKYGTCAVPLHKACKC